MVMNRRMRKELRALFFPWCAAVSAALLGLARFAIGDADNPTDGDLLLFNLVELAFCGGVVLMAALPFGLEFQNRTLPLLLAQPISRSRLWMEKMLALTLAVSSVALIRWLGEKYIGRSEMVLVIEQSPILT